MHSISLVVFACFGAAQGTRISHADAASQAFDVLDFADRDVSQTAKMRAMKTPAYKEMWPSMCTGENGNGKAKFRTSVVNGFACESDKGKAVAKIHAPAWFADQTGGAICCDGRCGMATKCMPLNLRDAAKKVTKAVTEISVAGSKVDVLHQEVSPADAAHGVLQEMSIKIPEKAVAFNSAKSTLTKDSVSSVNDIAEQLGAYLAMLGTANSGAKLLMCPHGTTTGCLPDKMDKARKCKKMNGAIAKLPEQRAATMAAAFKAIIPAVEVGQAHGHHAYENGSFKGGRFGSVQFKIFSGATPACNHDDFYGYYN